MAQQWYKPHTSEGALTAPEGVFHAPSLLYPVHSTLPSAAATLHVKPRPPTATAERPVVGAGAGTTVCPRVLTPKQTTEPVVVTAHVCANPHETAATVEDETEDGMPMAAELPQQTSP
jgi:hypothetical protein